MAFIVILKYIIVSIIISLLFGITVFSSIITKKVFKKDFINPYLFQLWSLILFIIIWCYCKPELAVFNTYSLLNWNNILLLVIAVIPTSIISYQGNKFKPTSSIRVDDFLKGASMEISQRLLVQNLFVLLGVNIFIYGSLTLDILLNSLVWIQFIIIQKIINGNKISISISPEIIASFWFSIWVGILYKNTGNIIIPMLAHGLQRVLTYKIRQKFGKTKTIRTNI